MIDHKKTAGFVEKLRPYIALCLLILPLAYHWAYAFKDVRFYLKFSLFCDDAFYYFKIARNISDGLGMTFDGLNKTNGVQPLWQLVLVPVFMLVKDREAALHVVNVIQIFFYITGLAFVYGVGYQITRKPLFSIAGVLTLSFLTFFSRINLHGLETSIYFCFFAGTLFYLLKYSDNVYSSIRYLVGLSVILCLLNMARTDSLILSGLIVLYGSFRMRHDVKKIAIFIVPFMLIIGPYLLYNYIQFGDFMPVSGAAKKYYSQWELKAQIASGRSFISLIAQNLIWPITLKEYSIFAVFIVNVIGLVIFIIQRRVVLSLFFCFLLLKYLSYAVMYYNHASFLWYYAIDFVGPYILLSHLLTLPRNKTIQQVLSFCAALIALCFAWTNYKNNSNSLHYFDTVAKEHREPARDLEYYYYGAKLMNQFSIPNKMVFGMHNSGVFGYFFDGTVVNMDGLVNGRQRLKYIKLYGYDYDLYQKEVQPLDAYLDIVDPKPYDESFNRKGYKSYDFQESIEAQYGKGKPDFGDGVRFRLFVLPEHMNYFKSVRQLSPDKQAMPATQVADRPGRN